jgi:hypothetical protein
LGDRTDVRADGGAYAEQPATDQAVQERADPNEEIAMTSRFASFAMALLSATGVTAASELAPGGGYSIHLGRFDGAVYYTVEPDGYRVVATLASRADAPPIRFASTLQPGQRIVISVPQAAGQPSIDFEIVRDGDAVRVSDLLPPSDLVDEVSVLAPLNP